jgi:type VI secretion system secreted protein VgrG
LARTQQGRPFRFKTPLGADTLLLESFSGYESLSKPYRYVFRVLAESQNIDMKGLLTKPVVLSIELPHDKERHIHANVRSMKMLESGDDGLVAYEVEAVPWLWYLSLFHDCRIFQNKSVPDIVQQVFKDRGFSHYRLALQGSFPPREYCVQYRETDLNFVSRLLEEEGIFYFFEHTDSEHTLVLANQQGSIPVSPHQPEARFMPSVAVFEDDMVTTLEAEQRLETGKWTMTDYDFEKPNNDLASTLSSDRKGEYYDYPGNYLTKDDGDRYARIRLEEEEVGLNTVRADTSCKGFEAGYKFTLKDHFRDDLNQQYVITSLRVEARNSSYRSDPTAEPPEYHNRIEAVPASVPYRPRRIARKPVVEGTQTATVVGKSGEEIWTDKYGRVKCQFRWDREGKADENSSCFIRVGQAWAGKQWGCITIPRIGEEVIVSFLEGDPDRPIITGRVYNAVQMPPYPLPDQQNLSAMKSMSSKGGGGFNELTFDDTKGKEQVLFHAQYNMDVRVKNNEYKTVEKDLHLTINQDRFEHVKNDFHATTDRDTVQQIGRDNNLEVKGKQAIKVTGSHTLQVTGDVAEVYKANHSEDTTGNVFIKSGSNLVVEGATCITLKCGGSSVVLNASGVSITGAMVTIVGNSVVLINSGPGSPPVPGIPCSAVAPASPKAAEDAAIRDPGQLSQTQNANRGVASTHLADEPPTPHKPMQVRDEDPVKKKTWIEIKLEDEEGNPVPGEPYKVTMGDETVATGTLDGSGKARVDGIDPGQCKVTFPRLDKTVWRPK